MPYRAQVRRGPSGVGKRLETPDGAVHGRIVDVIFDLASGLVLGYEFERPDHSRRIAPAVGPVREEAERVTVPDVAIRSATPDLSALMAMRDPVTGALLFPLSEEF